MVLKSLKTPLRNIEMVPYSRDVLRNGQSTNYLKENPVVLQGILFSLQGSCFHIQGFPCLTPVQDFSVLH